MRLISRLSVACDGNRVSIERMPVVIVYTLPLVYWGAYTLEQPSVIFLGPRAH
ncbi:hypothetical protein RSAG8_02567, partial [Rhizoctonia solani AG-8 WAC10335]